MNEKLEAMIAAMGALAEMSYLFYTNLITQGFTEEKALELTKEVVRACVKPRNDGGTANG